MNSINIGRKCTLKQRKTRELSKPGKRMTEMLKASMAEKGTAKKGSRKTSNNGSKHESKTKRL